MRLAGSSQHQSTAMEGVEHLADATDAQRGPDVRPDES
jgi:hypothetical protein